jgi:hypothetical protein
MEIVKQVQQLDKNTEMSPVTCTEASYYVKEEIYMFPLMGEGGEDVFLSIFVRAVKHTKPPNFFGGKNTYTFSPDS